MANNPSTWTQKDAIALRGFLASNPKVKAELESFRPDQNLSPAEYGSQMRGMDRMMEKFKSMLLDPQQGELPAGFIPSEDEHQEEE